MKRRERMAVELTRTHVFFYFCSNAEFDISTQYFCKLSSYFLVRLSSTKLEVDPTF